MVADGRRMTRADPFEVAELDVSSFKPTAKTTLATARRHPTGIGSAEFPQSDA
jgi:hypothetical protein